MSHPSIILTAVLFIIIGTRQARRNPDDPWWMAPTISGVIMWLMVFATGQPT